MLQEEETSGALVVGRPFSIDDFEGLEALRDQARSVGAELYVAGDTSETGGEESIGVSIVGFAVAIASVDGAPVEVTRAAIDSAVARAEKIDWSVFEGQSPEVYTQGFGDDDEGGVVPTPSAGAYLLAWGPLPYAALSIGVRLAAEEGPHGYTKPKNVRHEFFSMQDMSQEWGAEGVDGVAIASVEFSDCALVDLSPSAVSNYAAAVSDLSDAKVFLTARYD